MSASLGPLCFTITVYLWLSAFLSLSHGCLWFASIPTAHTTVSELLRLCLPHSPPHPLHHSPALGHNFESSNQARMHLGWRTTLCTLVSMPTPTLSCCAAACLWASAPSPASRPTSSWSRSTRASRRDQVGGTIHRSVRLPPSGDGGGDDDDGGGHGNGDLWCGVWGGICNPRALARGVRIRPFVFPIFSHTR